MAGGCACFYRVCVAGLRLLPVSGDNCRLPSGSFFGLAGDGVEHRCCAGLGGGPGCLEFFQCPDLVNQYGRGFCCRCIRRRRYRVLVFGSAVEGTGSTFLLTRPASWVSRPEVFSYMCSPLVAWITHDARGDYVCTTRILANPGVRLRAHALGQRTYLRGSQEPEIRLRRAAAGFRPAQPRANRRRSLLQHGAGAGSRHRVQ